MSMRVPRRIVAAVVLGLAVISVSTTSIGFAESSSAGTMLYGEVIGKTVSEIQVEVEGTVYIIPAHVPISEEDGTARQVERLPLWSGVVLDVSDEKVQRIILLRD